MLEVFFQSAGIVIMFVVVLITPKITCPCGACSR